MMDTPLTKLSRLRACSPALDWVASPTIHTLSEQELWECCHRPGWMLWYLGRIAQGLPAGFPQHKRVVLATILCVRELVPLVRGCDFGPGFSQIEAWARRFDDEPMGRLDVPVYLGANHAVWRTRSYMATVAHTRSNLAAVCQLAIGELSVAAGATAFGDPFSLCRIIRDAVPNVPVVYLLLPTGELP